MKKIFSLLLILVMALGIAACTQGSDPNDPNGGEPGNTGSEEPDLNTNMKLNDLVKNFWETDTMYDESVMLVAQTDGQGNVTVAPRAKLLFPATQIITVKQYYDGEGNTLEFEEGKDFIYEDGYLVAKGEVVHDPISEKDVFRTEVPYVTDAQVSGREEFPNLAQNTDIPSSDGGYLPFTEGYQIVQQQLSVTYRHEEGLWEGTVPAYCGDALSRSLAKLENKEDVELFIYGDSISTGANSSSVLGIAPNLDTWDKLFASNLSSWFGGKVEVTNRAVGGWTTVHGVGGGNGYVGGKLVYREGLSAQFNGELADYSPDIAVIGFGMNDASNGVPINNYLANTKDMIDTVLKRNPSCDIILLGTMLANPKAVNQSKNQQTYSQNLQKVADMYDNCVVVDIGLMHADLLNVKQYIEMTSNNVNHPNDFIARIYAMHLLSAYIKSGKTEGTGDVGTAAYSDLIADHEFSKGFTVSVSKDGGEVQPDGSVKLYHDEALRMESVGADKSSVPEWTLAQWGSKYDFLDSYRLSYYEGGNALRIMSKGKTLNGEYVPAKVLDVNGSDSSIYIELNAQTEYDAPRRSGESWPHVLLSQDFSDRLVHVASQKEIVMAMEFEITKFEDCMGASADRNLHCAQFVFYVTLQNRTKNSAGYGEYVWFGIGLWDNRNVGTVTSLFAAQDGGKENNTGAFIYSPSSSLYYPELGGVVPEAHTPVSMRCNIVEAARAAFDLAKQRNFLSNTAWEDLYVGGMNFGFEVTGTYNVGANISKVGIYY